MQTNTYKHLALVMSARQSLEKVRSSWTNLQASEALSEQSRNALSSHTDALFNAVENAEKEIRIYLNRKINRFGNGAILQANIASVKSGLSKRIIVRKPDENIEEPYITETIYKIMCNVLKAPDGELVTKEDFLVYVVSARDNTQIIRTIKPI